MFDNILAYAASISVGVGLAIQFVKQPMVNKIGLDEDYIPILSVVTGALFALLVYAVVGDSIDLSLKEQIAGGAVAGVMSTGIYENVKKASHKVVEKGNNENYKE